jgi:hypothetical protein
MIFFPVFVAVVDSFVTGFFLFFGEGSDTEDDGGSMLSDSFNGSRTGLRKVMIFFSRFRRGRRFLRYGLFPFFWRGFG